MPQLKIDLVVDDKGSLVMTGFGNKVDKVMWSAKDAAGQLGQQLAVVGAGFAALSTAAGLVVGKMANIAGESEQLRASLDTITKGQGVEWFEKLNDWALKMPVNTNEAIKTFQMLRSMGLEPTIEDMTTLVDTSAAMGGQAGTLEGIARALGQIQTKGKVSAEEMMQLAERGIPAYEILEEKLGLTKDQLGNLGKAGIDAGEAVQALLDGMSERYGGLSEKLNKMWFGQTEALRSYGNEFVRLVMESGPMQQMEDRLGGIIDQLDTWRDDGTLKQWAEETGKRMVEVGTAMYNAGEAIGKFLWNHKELVGALLAAKVALPFLVASWKILNTTWLLSKAVLTGLPILVTSTNAALTGMIGTTMTLGAAFTTIAAAGVALFAGYKLGEWLTMGKSMREINEATAELERNTKKASGQFKEISRDTGVVVTSMDDLTKAVDEGRIHFDELTGTWKAGAGEMAEAVGKSAEEQKRITSAKLAEMKEEYQKYVDEIKRLQDLITGRERSLAAELRAMARTGMDAVSAWRDRRAEADEYYQAAQRAAEAGNFDEAVKFADEAKTAYKELNKEVKEGNTVLISGTDALDAAMTGVKAAGELAIDILGKQKKAAEDAAKALDDEAGGQLSASLDAARKSAEDLNKVIKDSGGDWAQVWDQMESDAKEAIDASEQRIVKLTRDREVTVYINEVVKKSAGGAVARYAGGGLAFPRLGSPYITSGGGMVDDVPALLKRNEFVMNPSATAYYGVDRMYAMNRLQVPRDAIATASTGGLAGDLGALVRRSNIQHFAEGGLAVPQAAASATGPALAIDLRISDGPAVRAWTDRQGYDSFLREAARRKRLASA